MKAQLKLVPLTFVLFSCSSEKEEADSGTDDTNISIEDTAEPSTENLFLSGEWTDGWGQDHSISNTLLDSYWAKFNISQYDNTEGWLVAQNDATNEYNPELWSKFEWVTDDDGELFVCQSVYEADSEQSAIDAPSADQTNLEIGCGGFAWSKIRASFDFTGDYDDEWGTSHSLTPWTMQNAYGLYHVSQYDNAEGWFVAQNDSTNEYSPELWSKFDITSDSEGNYSFCQSSFDSSTEQDAIDAASADSTDPLTGCAGYSWTGIRESLTISGSWLDAFDAPFSISSWKWSFYSSTFNVSQHDNLEGWAVAQNDSANEYNPDLWSFFQWTVDLNGEVYYCQSNFDAADESSALETPLSDVSDLDTGCGGFPWSLLVPGLDE